jgi:outer membrane protein
MKIGYYLIFATLLIVSVVICFILFNQPKIGYVYNQVVFDGFDGRKELEQKLNLVKKNNKLILDSVEALVQSGRKDLIPIYQGQAEAFFEQEKQLADRYTKDVWEYLNSTIYQYGKDNKYDFILGTSGSGNLMYADSLNDVTQEVLQFVNDKYSGN